VSVRCPSTRTVSPAATGICPLTESGKTSVSAVDPARRAALWAYRERHTEAVNHVGTPHKLDVAVPLTALAPFLDGVPSVVAAVFGDARTWLFGHAADGNVHVNVTGVDPDDERVDEAVLRYTASLGGSISAEHGIGRAKTRWLTLNRSPEELAAFAALKRALDPSGILNPGVLVV
jgi:FAD/FMN-containing dehydrogenase